MLQVNILSHTEHAESVVATAAKTCYSNLDIQEIMTQQLDGDPSKLIERLWTSGHHSPFEHASYTFGVSGISRVTSHQLVRHRIATYTQASQRYISVDEPDLIIPPSVRDIEGMKELMEIHAHASLDLYNELIRNGVPQEDARYILPHGCSTQLVVTMNARSLLHFFNIRLCRRAQWEIRAMAGRMLQCCLPTAPNIFKYSGPSCFTEGMCNEAVPCGKPHLSKIEDMFGIENDTSR